jgi:hypothetical protein
VISLLGALLLGAQLGLAALWSSGIDRTVIGVLAALLGVGALLSIPAVRGRLPRTRWLMLALALILVMCGAPQASQLLPMEPGILASRVAPPAAVVPAYTAHMARVQESLKQEIPIVMLSEGLDDAQRTAQDLAVHDSRVLSKLRAKTGEPLRNEVFAVRPARQSDITDETAACRSGRCLRVEIYHYADNSATVAMVDVATRAVVAVADLPQMQPDIPKDLEQAAIEIAVSAPEVERAFGSKPNASQATMAEMKTSLNNTRCERSQHLCVAPTFLVGDKALWAIVDLTDGVLVGVQWTNLGASQTPKITESSATRPPVSIAMDGSSTTCSPARTVSASPMSISATNSCCTARSWSTGTSATPGSRRSGTRTRWAARCSAPRPCRRMSRRRSATSAMAIRSSGSPSTRSFGTRAGRPHAPTTIIHATSSIGTAAFAS